jgi:FecR protein
MAHWRFLLLAVTVSGMAATAQAGQSIGTAAIIEKSVTATLPEAPAGAPLHRGDGLFENERVETGVEANAQLLFADESALTISANSTVVLDKFVYDPKPNVGTVVINTVEGAFRFIGGTADTVSGSSYEVKTPVGTIGIRGTYFEWEIKGDTLSAVLHEGAISVCVASGSCRDLDRPGTYVITRGTSLSGIQRWDGPASPALQRLDSAPDPVYQERLNTAGPMPISAVAVLPPATPSPSEGNATGSGSADSGSGTGNSGNGSTGSGGSSGGSGSGGSSGTGTAGNGGSGGSGGSDPGSGCHVSRCNHGGDREAFRHDRTHDHDRSHNHDRRLDLRHFVHSS